MTKLSYKSRLIALAGGGKHHKVKLEPNDLLPPAGYPPMNLFQRVLVYPDSLPSDIGALVKDLQRIPDRTQRRKLAEAVRVLIAGYLADFEHWTRYPSSFLVIRCAGCLCLERPLLPFIYPPPCS